MGRRKSYQRDEVIPRALQAFWASGYEATSVKDLEVATGLNKFGIYETFENKRGLFLACLDYYSATYLVPFFEAFDPMSSPEAPGDLLRGVIHSLEMTGGLGCALLNAGVESGGRDAEIQERIRKTYALLTDKLSQHWDSRPRAEAFTALVRGLMASGRLSLGRDALELVVEGSRPLWLNTAGQG